MAARFDRALSEDFFVNHLDELRDLIQSIATIDGEDPCAFDIHLRENDKIMIYHGETCVLTVALKNKDHPFNAHKTYGQEDRDCSSAYLKLVGLHTWSRNEAKILMKEYLEKIPKSVHRSKYGNLKEGFWKNKLGVRFGRHFEESDPWLIVDREAVIGFENEKDKENFYGPMKDGCAAFVRKLQDEDTEKWGKSCKRLGNELDLLVLDKDKNLVCIELKHGKAKASEIYWGPAQVSLYRNIFGYEAVIGTVSVGIKKMVKQKVALGLLPRHALGRLPEPEVDFACPRAILAIAEPQRRHKDCWNSLKRVLTKLSQNVEVATIEEDGNDFIIRPLEDWLGSS